MKFKSDITIRPIQLPQDSRDVLTVEREAFACAAPFRPWGPGEFWQYLDPARRRCGWVLVAGDALAGYVLADMLATRIRIVRLAVHPAARRGGLASRLIAHLKSGLNGLRRKIIAEVPEPATACLAALKANRFRAVSILSEWHAGHDFYQLEFRTAPRRKRPLDVFWGETRPDARQLRRRRSG